MLFRSAGGRLEEVEGTRTRPFCLRLAASQNSAALLLLHPPGPVYSDSCKRLPLAALLMPAPSASRPPSRPSARVGPRPLRRGLAPPRAPLLRVCISAFPPSSSRFPTAGADYICACYLCDTLAFSFGIFRLSNGDRKSTRLNSSHRIASRMPSSA